MHRPHLPPLVLAALLLAGCGRFTTDGAGTIDPPDPPRPLDPLPGSHATLGLVSAAGGNRSLSVRWRLPEDESQLPARLAVFIGPAPDTLLDQEPLEVDEALGKARFGNLPSDSLLYAGLAARDTLNTTWIPLGPALAFHTGEPLYVNPLAPLFSGDGLTPATAYQDLTLALVMAPVLGRHVLWVSAGPQDVAQLPLYTGLHVVGGFSDAFTLAARDPKLHATTLRAIDDTATTNDPAVVTVTPGEVGVPATLDGFQLEGLATTTVGVDSSGHEFQARGVAVSGCVRGFRLRALPNITETDVVLAGCSARGAVNEGLSVDGAWDLWLEACDFDNNGAEGAALGKLYAADGRTTQLVVRGCRFTRNVQEGLDAQLGAIAGGAGTGGKFSIVLEESDFLDNGLDGVRVDVDYELVPGWSSRMTARGLSASGNGLAGVHFDLDGASTLFAHRLACRSNGTDGFQLSSESWSGIATLSCSALWGNLGAGARATFGHVGLVATHCAFAGNVAGGFVADTARCFALDCAAEAQPSPWIGVDTASCLASGAPETDWYAHTPREYATVTAYGAGSVQTAAATASGIGARLELADDGVARTITAAPGTTLVLDPAPDARPVPLRAWLWQDDVVQEDWRAEPAGALVAAGLTGLDGESPDLGPYGAARGGTPGRDDIVPLPLFALVHAAPSLGSAIASDATLVLQFLGGEPDASTLAQGVAVRRGTGLLSLGMSVVDGKLELAAPVGGWLDGDRLELHPPLASLEGVPLAAPFALTLDVL